MKALLVDDSRAQRCVVRNMLKEFGIDVVEAVDGKDGLAKLCAMATADIAIVDWNMPEMNGLELIKEIRSRSEFQGVPILMATTETEMTQVATVLAAGANEYVMKPYGKEDLHDKLVLLGVL
jgi:two-component system chemotaxis response regulator CheY